jgi:hypothetical protein
MLFLKIKLIQSQKRSTNEIKVVLGKHMSNKYIIFNWFQNRIFIKFDIEFWVRNLFIVF